MDTASINWLTTLAFAIIGGGLIGLVMGHKMKEDPMMRLETTPILFLQGHSNKILVIVGVGLIALCFTISIWHGLAAIVLGFMIESFVGVKVMQDEKGGVGKTIKITVILLLIVCLPFGGYQYYQYNRAPNEQDRLAFIYECDEYLAKEIFKSDDRDSAKATCSCLWPDLAGRYQTIGKINEKARDDGRVSIGDKDVNAMSLTCLKDYQNRD